MELQARVTALEEEVGILKGEIKAILQEVRVAVLARQNPFLETTDPYEPPAPMAAPSPAIQPEPAIAPAPAPQAAAPKPAEAAPIRPFALPAEPASAIDFEELLPPRPDKTRSQTPLDLAALLTWVQDSLQSFSASDFAMLVRIGTYGDLIEEGLEDTLLDMVGDLSGNEGHKASLGDFALALQKLAALRENAPVKQSKHRRNAA